MTYQWTWSSRGDSNLGEGAPARSRPPRDPVDVWCDLHVMFRAASEADGVTPGSVRAGDLPPIEEGQGHDVPTTVVDVRRYFPMHHFMDELDFNRRHDGRHSRAPAWLFPRLCPRGRTSLISVVMDLLVEAASVRFYQVVIFCVCRHGRHRSVSAAIALAHFFHRVCGLRTDSMMLDRVSSDGRHASRLCSIRGCMNCSAREGWSPTEEEVALVRAPFVELLRGRLAEASAVRQPFYCCLLDASD